MDNIAKTTYKDDVLDISKNTRRKYNMITNNDSTVSFEDATEYIQNGDEIGSAVLNTIFSMLGGFSLKVLTQGEFDSLSVKEENTLYFIKEE